VLEEIVRRANEIELCRNGELWQLPTATLAEKERAFEEIYWWLRGLDEATQRSVVRVLADRHEIDIGAMTHDLIMSWQEIRGLATDPLVTVGAHTKAHYAIAKLSPEKAREELEESADRLEDELGVRPAHFSFPYGDVSSVRARDFAIARELGFKTAVTTPKGVLFPAHRWYATAFRGSRSMANISRSLIRSFIFPALHSPWWTAFSSSTRREGGRHVGPLHPADEETGWKDPGEAGGERIA
jgi:hypothetical protein